MNNQKAFQLTKNDNVATVLTEIKKGPVQLLGISSCAVITAQEEILHGHKIALVTISKGSNIIKYNVPIGIATKDIKKGTWVHLHCICSKFDRRSSTLDVTTGAPKDIVYE